MGLLGAMLGMAAAAESAAFEVRNFTPRIPAVIRRAWRASIHPRHDAYRVGASRDDGVRSDHIPRQMLRLVERDEAKQERREWDQKYRSEAMVRARTGVRPVTPRVRLSRH